MEGLFSAVELQDAATDLAGRAGYRLDRLEVFNWGTFDGRVWGLDLDGRNGLLTGDIGSGKSTVVDAVTTLLVASHRISYNKAAGAGARERSLRSYVAGHYKAERDETTGSSRQVGLRDGATYSVILGRFANAALGTHVTLAQVFWLTPGHSGQPDRFFVTAPQAMSIAADFASFDAEIGVLRRRLRERGAQVRDHFPEYGRDFRRLLGIPSEQAMDLFHKTVSMKSVGDLGEFVREHMVEPFDAEQWTNRLIAHFDDLTSAHDAVVRARTQIEQLAPIVAACDQYDALAEQAGALVARREALPRFVASRRIADLDGLIGALTAQVVHGEAERERVGAQRSDLLAHRRRLELERAGHGGDRLAAIESETVRREAEQSTRRRRVDHLIGDMVAGGLIEAPADPQDLADRFDQAAFDALRARIGTQRRQFEVARADADEEIAAIRQELRDADREAAEITADLQSASRGSNLPRAHVEVRDRLADALGVDREALPFVGELVAVAGADSQWEGAAERVLRSFALSLLVPHEVYGDAAEWIDREHLGLRLAFYRVGAQAPVAVHPDRTHGRVLADMLEVRPGPYAPWVYAELERRANYVCVATAAELRVLPRAVTRAGQVKHSASQHEKDDVRAVDDRRSYVLGWSAQAKVETLQAQGAQVAQRRAQLADAQTRAQERKSALAASIRHVDRVEVFADWDELDWRSQARRIGELSAEKRELEGADQELGRIAALLEANASQMAQCELDRDAVVAALGADRHALDAARGQRERAAAILAETAAQWDEDIAAALGAELDRELTGAREAEDLDAAEAAVRDRLTREADAAVAARADAATRIAGLMAAFRSAYPVETAELDTDVRAADGYRQIAVRLATDDLPRFEADFKSYLNTNAVRDIAGFGAELAKQADVIRDRIDTINDSLRAIDYNPGRYIRLEMARTPNVEVRDFQRDLRACADGAGALVEEGQVVYSEERFLRVKALVERFRGRDGMTDLDDAWRRRVTDVRNWFILSASERFREDDSEHEHYSDSGGKSGGQKEKLAYTVLAASLAYQFKLDWGAARSTAFRFVVIDEAFGRGSDESTRFALELFRRLGLQLLIVTPLQKIHVIEPYINAVGFVDNPSGRSSRLRTVAIETYRAGVADGNRTTQSLTTG